MRVLTLYFSGTGNTEFVAKYLQRKLTALAINSDLKSIEETLPENCTEYDLLIIGFPVYAGAAPEFFRQFLNLLPNVEQKGMFVFCTKAMFTGKAISDINEQLSSKGYIPIDYKVIGMPGSDALPFMSKSSKYVYKAVNKNYSNLKEIDELAGRIADVINNLNQGKSIDFIRREPPKGIPLLNKVFQFLWDFGYGLAEKKIKPNFWVDQKCINCGLCIKQCPAKNISWENDAINFNTHCYMCMRCINQCPQEAIQIGKGTVDKFRWRGPRGDFKPECK